MVEKNAGAVVTAAPTLSEAFRTFAKIGLMSFGGPAGQIALMHRELVDDRGWIDEQDFLHALNFCHLLPGPEAQQLATYIGWKLHGVRGGLLAGLLFILPGALVMFGLCAAYVLAAHASWFAAIFLGIKAAVLAIIVQALLRLSSRALDTATKRWIALSAFVALAFFEAPFPLVVLAAALLGWMVSRKRPDLLALTPVAAGGQAERPAFLGTVVTIGGWGVIWAVPLALVWLTLGPDHILWKIGTFFSQLAVVTFGGAYAVLAYMAQQAVDGFGWLTAGQMGDGLGLAETTPGPLILVTQFVGFLAAWGAPDPFSPWLAAFLGGAMTLWVTFTPCFLWIFAFAPWIDRMRAAQGLRGSLAAITASIVGVIASLAVWFALHLLIRPAPGTPVETAFTFLDVDRVDWRAALIACLAAFLLFGRKWGIPALLIICALSGFALGFVGASVNGG